MHTNFSTAPMPLATPSMLTRRRSSMAAATGDVRWEERYRTHEPRLAEALAEAMLLDPSGGSEAGTRRTFQANARLVEAERQAFELVRAGRLGEASALLDGASYRQDKRAYSAGVAEAMGAVQARLNDAVQRQGRLMLRVQIGVPIFGFAVLAIWLALVRRLLQWRDLVAEAAANERRSRLRLQHVAARLEGVNAHLEERVRSRTQEITRQRDELRQVAESLLLAEHRERRRLASVLHDDLQQLLVAAQLRLGATARRLEGGPKEELDAVASTVRSAVQVSRSLATELNPPQRLEGDLVQALAQVADELQRRTGLGLPMIRQRARWLGGGLEITSTPGQGTRARLVLPEPQGAAGTPRRAGDGATVG